MLKIEAATADDVRFVARNMRARDFEEFTAVSATDDRDEMADGLAQRYGGRDDVLCGSYDGEPICIGGTIEVWPGVMTLLFFATPEFPRIGLPIARFIRNKLFPRYEAAGIHRIQAISLDGYEEVHSWMRTIGLVPENAPMPAYGKRGEAFQQFVRLRDVRPAGA